MSAEDQIIYNISNNEKPTFHDCWNQIGVMGDRSCSELPSVIHCYECPVYAAVGDSLLEREPPLDYLDNWLNILEETSNYEDIYDSDQAILRTDETVSMMIFSLGNETLGLPVKILQEVTHPCVIQPLPHRSNQLFLGLVNIRGETLLCASLSHLLHIQTTENTVNFEKTKNAKLSLNKDNLQRMIVAGKEDDKWVFPVDEVHGIFRFHINDIQDVPVVITKSEIGYTKGVVNWEGKQVNFLDDELLFYNLNHKIL